MKTNAELRKQAISLSWQNRGILWAAFLIFALVNFLWNEIQTYQIRDALTNYILGIIYHLVMAPVMCLGLYHMLMHIISGDKAKMPMLLDFVRTPKVAFKSMAVGLVTVIPDLMIFLYIIASAKPEIERDETKIIIIMTAIALVTFLWMMLRLFLLPYLYVTNPQESVLVLLNKSFQTMKGQVLRLLWYAVTVLIWPFLLVIVLMYMINPLVNFSLIYYINSYRLAFQLVMYLLLSFIGPFFSLAFACYAKEHMSSQQNMKNTLQDEQ